MSPPSFPKEEKPSGVTVTVEPATQVHNQPSKFSRTRVVVAVVLVTLLVAIVTLCAFIAFKQLRHQDKEDFDTVSNIRGSRVPEHVRVDHQNEVIYVSNKQEGEIDGLNALHVYSRGMLAFKDLTNNKCYIDRLDMTFREGLAMWQSFQGKERFPKRTYFRYIEEPIDSDVLRTFGGELIAEHCRDVPTHWIVALPSNVAESQQFSFMKKTAEFICFPDSVVLDPTFPPVPLTVRPVTEFAPQRLSRA